MFINLFKSVIFTLIVITPIINAKDLTLTSRLEKSHKIVKHVESQKFQKNELGHDLMYEYNLSDFTEITATNPIHDQPLPFRLPFFGFNYNYIWIQRDGYLAFNRGLLSYKFPIKFPYIPAKGDLINEDPAMIAPWFALQDIPIEVPYAGVYLKVVNIQTEQNYTLRDQIYHDFSQSMIGAADFKPKFALIITWRNMTMINRRPEMPLLTNTYQAVIATDEIRTYAMFNYEQIQWITHQDPYQGLKGSPAYVGFNAGNSTGTFEFRPYSQNPRISYLTTRGWGNDLRGRYYFQIDQHLWPGACIEKDLDPTLPDRLPLTFFPQTGSMLGGAMVNITGPCLNSESVITCKFENWEVPAIFRDYNHATCITPPIMYHGYVDLTVTVDGRTNFIGQFYMEAPNMADTGDIVVLNGADRLEKPDTIEIKWPTKPFLGYDLNARLTLSLWGYRESDTVYPKLTYIDTLWDADSVRLGQGHTIIDTSVFKDRHNYNETDIQFGFIAINLTDPTILGKDFKTSPVLWSKPMPLAWYFNAQWDRQYGNDSQWKDHFCNNWSKQESQYGDKLNDHVWQCPCTLAQAELDKGRYVPDNECNVITRICDTFHRGALACFKSARPSIDGSGQTCCYDDYGELLQTGDTMYGGRPSRSHSYGKHPFKMPNIIPGLSEWHHDIMPFFQCCKWQPNQDNSESCQTYNKYRPSQYCTAYTGPAIGSVYGDPHFITFDGLNYTFNAMGEFTLIHVDNALQKLDVQARFEQMPRKRRTDPAINSTQLQAVVASGDHSSIVEFRLRPVAARGVYRLYVLVDNQYIQDIWHESGNVLNFKGLTLYQPNGIQNLSHVIAMFDSGAGLEVITDGDQLTVHVYIPDKFLNETSGLLGLYSKDPSDDFVRPDGKHISIESSQVDIHQQFGMSWRVQERMVYHDNQTSSLFDHDIIPFEYYDEPDFTPDFGLPPPLPDWAQYLRPEMDAICGDSIPCQYDYIMTLDKDYAKVTKLHEMYANNLAKEASKKYIRCPALPRPFNGRKSNNCYWPGTIVQFSCDVGYKLVGDQTRRCREDGQWSTGVTTECVKQL